MGGEMGRDGCGKETMLVDVRTAGHSESHSRVVRALENPILVFL